MRMIEHANNSLWWHAKVGEATAEQVATFARKYTRGEDASAWAVTVTEGAGWVSADHISHVMAQTRSVGAVCVWVSDGHFAQCVWRREAEADCGMVFDVDQDAWVQKSIPLIAESGVAHG